MTTKLKHKIVMGVGTSLLCGAAVVTPLAITLSRTCTNKIDDLDNQYGIDRTTYDNMEGDLVNKYKSNLEAQHLSSEEIDAKMAKLSSSLKILDEAVQRYEQEKTANIYTSATATLMQTAKFDYDVDLVRNSRANWNEVDEMFDGMSQSFETYMNNHDFDREKIQEVLSVAANQKEAIVQTLKVEYANDVLGGVSKAKTQLLSCFDTINAEIARLAAETRLVEFTSNYVFQFKEIDNDNNFKTNNRFDVMTQAGAFTLGQPISNQNMNKIFSCYNAVTRQKIDYFDADMAIPGYKLIPVFAGTVENPLKNEYSIKIDWRAIAHTFVGTEDSEKATAHLIDADQQFVNNIVTNKDKIQSIDDFFNHANEKIKLTEYKMLVTSNFESQKLSEIYFNGSANGANIELVWDQKFNPCYDGFMYINQSVTTDQTLNLRQLAMTNIAIKANGCPARLLKDVITTVEQENYEPKDVVENFVKYCDIVDTVRINKSGSTITSVTNNFSAHYKNQVRWDAHGQESIGDTKFGNTMDAKHLNISEVFFEQANAEYNMQHRDTYLLLDRGYESLYIKSTIVGVLSAIAVGVNVSAQICMLCQMISFFTVAATFWLGILHLVLFVICGVGLFLEIDKSIVFRDNFYRPMKEYRDNANDFHSEQSLIKKVKNELKTDLDYFVLIDKEHPYDPKSYNQKLQQFRDLPKEDQQKIFMKYHYFKTDFAKAFFDEASALHINPIQFKEDFSEWKNSSGQYAERVGGVALLIDIALGVEGYMADRSASLLTKSAAQSQKTAGQGSSKAATIALQEINKPL